MVEGGNQVSILDDSAKLPSGVIVPEGYILATRKHLERLPASVKRQLEKDYGTLTNALRHQLYVCGKKLIALSKGEN